MSWFHLCKTKKVNLKPEFFNSVNQIKADDWNSISKNSNVYLTLPYLKSLEDSLSGQVDMRYILFYNEAKKPVALAAVQILDFSKDGLKGNDVYCKVATKIKNKLIDTLDVKMMVCGNVFACGENGFMHTTDITPEEAYQNLSDGLYELRQVQKSAKPISVVLLKEFWPSSFSNSDLLKSAGFKDFKIDVNMVLKIHKDWKTFDDYLASMTTKFRTKAKGVFKKSADIVVKDLNESEISAAKPDIERLYSAVVERADFKFGTLTPEAFVQFKKNHPNDFAFKGYYLNNELIGFSSAFITSDTLDANYVGLNYEHNHTYSVYQRMLYDFVEMAIKHGLKELRLGRTAEEIKSCIGAEPTDMKLYLRHRNSISNKLLAPIIATITPSDFELRYPFKAEFSPVSI
jgi:predicted N-acyltransferase